MGAIPAEYFQYYYFSDEVLAELRGQADDPRRGHPRRGARLLAALPGAGRSRRPAARPGPLARRHPRAGAGDRRHGRGLQRPRRDAAGQRAERGRCAARLPRGPRGRGAGPLRRAAASSRSRPATAAPRARPGGDARRVPGAGGRGGLERHARRRRPGAGAQPARALARQGRARSTTSWPRRTARYLPERLLATERPWRELALLLGVDGGNTKTLAVVPRPTAAGRGGGRAGRADLYNARVAGARARRDREGLDGALGAAGANARRSRRAAFSLAGADWPEDFDVATPRTGEQAGPSHRARVVNDAVGALRCGTTDTVGVAAVIGTYGAVAGRSADGPLPSRVLARLGGSVRARLRGARRRLASHDRPRPGDVAHEPCACTLVLLGCG